MRWDGMGRLLCYLVEVTEIKGLIFFTLLDGSYKIKVERITVKMVC